MIIVKFVVLENLFWSYVGLHFCEYYFSKDSFWHKVPYPQNMVLVQQHLQYQRKFH